MAEILGTYPKARTSEADDAFDKAKRESGYTAFKGHDAGGGTIKMPKGMTAEQEAKWRAGLAKGQAAAEGADYDTGLKWTEEDTQRTKDIGKAVGQTAAEIAVAPYGLYKDLTEVQKLLAAGSVGAAVGAAGMAAAGPIGDAAKGASKVLRRALQSGDKAQAKHLDDWLAGRRGPEGLDPEVVDSVMIMRPDLRTPEAAQRIRGEVEGALRRRQAQEALDDAAGEFKPDFSQVERRIRDQERAGGLPRDYDPSIPTGRYQGRTRVEVMESLSPSEMQALSRARSLWESGDRGMGATQAYGEAVEELRRLDLEFLLHTPPPKGGW